MQRAVRGFDVVVNCAAWTAVDAAETNPGAAWAVNAVGPRFLAEACAETGARLVHVSTDYVFDGAHGHFIGEHEPPNPSTVYGRSKAAGEEAVRETLPAWIVRVAWMYGPGDCFLRRVAASAYARRPLTVVNDQWGQPTWARDVAERITRVTECPAGTYHASNTGVVSRYELAQHMYRALGANPRLVSPGATTGTPRPHWTALGHQAWDPTPLDRPRAWQDALTEAIHSGVFV